MPNAPESIGEDIIDVHDELVKAATFLSALTAVAVAFAFEVQCRGSDTLGKKGSAINQGWLMEAINSLNQQ